MIKAIFFDLDGTLVDTHRANYEAYSSALREVGVSITFKEFQKSIGYQANTFLRWFAPNLTDEEYVAISRRKAYHYKSMMHHTVPNKALIDFLKYIKNDCTTILVTTAKRSNAEAVLQHTKLDSCFDGIITAEDVKQSKPSSECYELALKRCGVKPSEALAFEDSEPGRKAAEGAGIPVIMIKDFALS